MALGEVKCRDLMMCQVTSRARRSFAWSSHEGRIDGSEPVSPGRVSPMAFKTWYELSDGASLMAALTLLDKRQGYNV